MSVKRVSHAVWGCGLPGRRWRLAAALAAALLLYCAPTRRQNVPVKYHDLPLIFIGGVPGSGLSLMRALLDAHPQIQCNPETIVMHALMILYEIWMHNMKVVELAGISKATLDNAIAAFSLEVIMRHGTKGTRLCNKEPFLLKKGTYITKLFPNAKFVFVIRDGRATVHSIISRKCKMLKDKCVFVRYEGLVHRPVQTVREVLEFLQLPRGDASLYHERSSSQANDGAFPNIEQVVNAVMPPINLDALHKWVDQVPPQEFTDISHLAPMLSVLGYESWTVPDEY